MTLRLCVHRSLEGNLRNIHIAFLCCLVSHSAKSRKTQVMKRKTEKKKPKTEANKNLSNDYNYPYVQFPISLANDFFFIFQSSKLRS